MMAKSVYKTVIFGAGQIGQMTARLLSSPVSSCALLIMTPINTDHILEIFQSVLRILQQHFSRIWSSWEFWMKNGAIL